MTPELPFGSAAMMALLLAGCFGSGGASGDGAAGNAAATDAQLIVGDWFVCIGADCEHIENQGSRFSPEGAFFKLWGDVALDNTISEPICVYEVEPRGTYAVQGSMIAVNDGQTRLSLELSIEDDRLTILQVPVMVSDGPTPPPEDVYMRRVATYEDPACDSDLDDVAPPVAATP